jgi:WD40 repeat protein
VLLRQEGFFVCADLRLELWDWTKRKPVTAVAVAQYQANPPDEWIEVLDYIPNEDRLITLRNPGTISVRNEQTIEVWKVSPSAIALERAVPLTIKPLKWQSVLSPDHRLMASTINSKPPGYGGTFHIWITDLTSGISRELVEIKTTPVRVIFSPDSKSIAVTGWQRVDVFDLESFQKRPAMPPADNSDISPLYFWQDGTHMVAGANGERKWVVYDMEHSEIQSVIQHGDVYGYTLSHDGSLLAVLDNANFIVDSRRPYLIELWDIRTGAQLPALCGDKCIDELRQDPNLDLKFSPDDRLLLLGGGIYPGLRSDRKFELGGIFTIWDVEARQLKYVLDPGYPQPHSTSSATGLPSASSSSSQVTIADRVRNHYDNEPRISHIDFKRILPLIGYVLFVGGYGLVQAYRWAKSRSGVTASAQNVASSLGWKILIGCHFLVGFHAVWSNYRQPSIGAVVVGAIVALLGFGLQSGQSWAQRATLITHWSNVGVGFFMFTYWVAFAWGIRMPDALTYILATFWGIAFYIGANIPDYLLLSVGVLWYLRRHKRQSPPTGQMTPVNAPLPASHG